MRRAFAAWGLAAALAACQQNLPVDRSAAAMIPREVAVAKLRELLPTADIVSCSLPVVRAPGPQVKSWQVDAQGLVFEVEDLAPLRLVYAEVTEVRLDKYVQYYLARLYTPAQAEPEREHFYFAWRTEEPARRAAELFEALRQK